MDSCAREICDCNLVTHYDHVNSYLSMGGCRTVLIPDRTALLILAWSLWDPLPPRGVVTAEKWEGVAVLWVPKGMETGVWGT